MSSALASPRLTHPTRFLSVCSGATLPGCGRVYASKLVKRQDDRDEIRSHGVCPLCADREHRYLDQVEEGMIVEANCPTCSAKFFGLDFEEACSGNIRCARCIAESTDHIAEVARHAEANANEHPFGTGFCEIPSSEIVQRIHLREHETATAPIRGLVFAGLLGAGAWGAASVLLWISF